MVDLRVYQAMASPLVGHTDPNFFGVPQDTSELLRYVFGANKEFTIAVPGTGSAGMEAAVVNFIEAKTKVAVLANGYSPTASPKCASAKAPTSHGWNDRGARCSQTKRLANLSSASSPRS